MTRSALPGRPPVVGLADWQAARDELLIREKAHTREGEALATARRRLPMAELDGTVEVVGGPPRGPPVIGAPARATPPGAPPGLLVLAFGRRRCRHLGADQPPRAAVDAPRGDNRGNSRPARPPHH
ncbi:DUF899 family protein [Streptomyces sp. Qhu-G9]|nr:DUF899 family protein [Streptomyces aurantiacus]WAU83239.1 DUF899 family protein [Streptomyces aurantiacus]